MSTTQPTEMPLAVKEKLMELARKLPEGSRSQFLINTSKEIGSFAAKFAAEHKYTIIYGGIGYLLGHLLDEVLTIQIPLIGAWKPTQNLAGLLLGLGGVGCGFMKDQDVYHFDKIIRNQIQLALNEKG